MKIIVTHVSPDWDAITSVWLLKRFLPGWNDAAVEFVPAGGRSPKIKKPNLDSVIEVVGEHEYIHVDTGMGLLDHHQVLDDTVCGTSRTWDYVKNQSKKYHQIFTKEHKEALSRIVNIIVQIDHFKEVFWDNPTADYHEFSLLGVLEGLKMEKPGEYQYYVEFGMQCLDALLHAFENRIWAEQEIKENGKEFQTRWGKGMGFSSLNDTVLDLAQKMGYVVVIRKDPRKGYVRIKSRPLQYPRGSKQYKKENDIDLTLVYEQLKKMDPQASWYLHVSKKMLLNGSAKNPTMVPSHLSLEELIHVLEKI